MTKESHTHVHIVSPDTLMTVSDAIKAGVGTAKSYDMFGSTVPACISVANMSLLLHGLVEETELKLFFGLDGNGSGYSDGYAYGLGDRNGYGGNGRGSGSSYSDGYAYGFGGRNGNGNGYSDGYGSSYSDGYGDGSGYGNSYGDGYGDGNGYGHGYAYGVGNSYGDGYGDGDALVYGSRV